MVPWLEGLLPFLFFSEQNLLPSIWIVGSILFALFFGLRFWLNGFKPCSKMLQLLESTFEELNGGRIEETYEKIKEQLSNSPTFKPIWKRFDESIVRVDQENRIRLFTTLDARHFFNESTLINPFINRRLYNSIPGLLTGLGILGTFVGLVIGLANINLEVIRTEEPGQGIEGLIEGIIGLLGGAKVAFSTSVWGILLSIIFSLYEKYAINALQNKLSALQSVIDEVFISRLPEHWLSENLQEQIEQTRELKRFNTDLALSIADALDQKMAERLTPALGELARAVEELKQTKSESSIEAIRELANEFKQNISEGTNEQITQLGQVLTRVGATLETTIGQSESTQERLKNALNEHVDKMAQTVTQLMGSIQQKQQELNEQTRDAIQQIMGRIEQSLSSQQQDIVSTSTRAREELTQQIQAISQSVESLVGNLDRQTSITAQDMQDRLANFSSLINDRFNDISGRYQEERSEISHILNQINTTMDKLEEMIEAVALATEAFGQTGPPVREAAVELNQAVSQFRQEQVEFTGTLKQSQALSLQQTQTAKETLEHMHSSLETTKESWVAYRDQFGRLREDLNRVFDSLHEGVTEYTQTTNESVTKYLQNFRDSLEKAMAILSGAIEELSETVEGMGNIRR
jgi:ABC-type transporter Mla subunit MlaD